MKYVSLVVLLLFGYLLDSQGAQVAQVFYSWKNTTLPREFGARVAKIKTRVDNHRIEYKLTIEGVNQALLQKAPYTNGDKQPVWIVAIEILDHNRHVIGADYPYVGCFDHVSHKIADDISISESGNFLWLDESDYPLALKSGNYRIALIQGTIWYEQEMPGHVPCYHVIKPSDDHTAWCYPK